MRGPADNSKRSGLGSATPIFVKVLLVVFFCEDWCQLAGYVLASGKRGAAEAEHGGRIFSFSVVPVPEAGYVNLYGRDITERKQARHLLETFAQSVVEGVPAMVITLDRHGRVQRFNKFARDLTG